MQVSVLLLLTAIQLHSTLLTQGTVIEGPSNVTYLPGLTPLPIELICNVTGFPSWRVNGTSYTLGELTNGALPGHSRTETNILISSPVNNTEYICVSQTIDGDTNSDPAYIIIAGVPAMVPDVTVDDDTISVNGNAVTLTLSWGEPFNNFDPIVNYTVSCSGDAMCPSDFTTTTRSHTITNLAIGPTYTLSVVATNSIGSGDAGTAPPGLPTTVPGVMIDDGTININGNNVTLTLSWGEPFNNLDPIVNYTVSCPGNVSCPPNFTTTDSTTRNYTITHLTTMTNYTFLVVATNSIGSGEAGVLNIITPVIDQVTDVKLMCSPVDLIIQCTVTWKPVAQTDITGYQVYYNGALMNVNSSTTMLTFSAPSLPDGVFTGTVVVKVSAVSGSGIGPTSETNNVTIYASSVTRVTPVGFPDNATSELYNITVTCVINSESTADQCVVVAVADGRMNRTGYAPIANGTATVTVTGLECGVTYTIIAGGTLNGDLVGPRSSHGITKQLCPSVESPKLDSDTLIIVIIIFIVIIVVGGGVLLVIVVIIKYRKHKNAVTEEKNRNSRSHKQKSSKVSSENDKAAQRQQNEYVQVNKSKPDPPATKQQMATQPPQDEYALVDKSKPDQPPAKQPEEGIQYLDLDIQKGPDKYGGQDHAVEYCQVVETKQ